MKILYISPEHISGTLPLFCEGHRRRGNEARYVTLFPSRFGFPEDLELKLPLHPDRGLIFRGKQLFNLIRKTPPDLELEGLPPFWKPGGTPETVFFKFRDWAIKRRVFDFIEGYRIGDYDVFHLEQGMGFFRNSQAMLEMKRRGKKIVCFYHGTDVRNRGVLPEIHRISDLNLTSELDIMDKYPGIKYLFLPMDTSSVKPALKEKREKVRIAHAARSRSNKGSDFIIKTVRRLEKKLPVELVFIENRSHRECMRLKASCDIYIDQIADRGGWGYGMSSVESLAQGLATCTYLNSRYLEFIPNHPFVNVNYENLEAVLTKLVEETDYREETARKGREWVVKTHDIEAVMTKLYEYYREEGIT